MTSRLGAVVASDNVLQSMEITGITTFKKPAMRILYRMFFFSDKWIKVWLSTRKSVFVRRPKLERFERYSEFWAKWLVTGAVFVGILERMTLACPSIEFPRYRKEKSLAAGIWATWGKVKTLLALASLPVDKLPLSPRSRGLESPCRVATSVEVSWYASRTAWRVNIFWGKSYFSNVTAHRYVRLQNLLYLSNRSIVCLQTRTAYS